MTFWRGSTAQLVTAFAAAIAIPFYLGFIHLTAGQLLVYSGVAGTAMATGDYVETPRSGRGGVRLFFADAMVWFTVIALIGGLAYLLALIF